MEKKLLWKWSSLSPESDNNQLPLSITSEKVIVILVLTVTLFIFITYISPMLGAWSYIAFIIAYLALLPYMLKNYKSPSIPTEELHISVFNTEININYYGLKGVYPLNNIVPESLVLKYIIVSRAGYVTLNKGLCFQTINPKQYVKIPIPIIGQRLSELASTVKVLTRHSG